MAVSYGKKYLILTRCRRHLVLLPGCSAIGKETMHCLADVSRQHPHAGHGAYSALQRCRNGGIRESEGAQRHKGPKIAQPCKMVKMGSRQGATKRSADRDQQCTPQKVGEAAEHGGHDVSTKAALRAPPHRTLGSAPASRHCGSGVGPLTASGTATGAGKAAARIAWPPLSNRPSDIRHAASCARGDWALARHVLAKHLDTKRSRAIKDCATDNHPFTRPLQFHVAVEDDVAASATDHPTPSSTGPTE